VLLKVNLKPTNVTTYNGLVSSKQDTQLAQPVSQAGSELVQRFVLVHFPELAILRPQLLIEP
jgi:hypothetical protein